MLSEAEGYEILGKYGVPVPAFKIVTTAEEAGDVAESIGFPVVMKIVSPPQIIHKSDSRSCHQYRDKRRRSGCI